MLHLDALTTPIFTPEMGRRLSIARMRMNLGQAELGVRLGVNQACVSKLEAGKLTVPRAPFTLAKFKEVLGEHWGFVLRGSNAEKYGYREARDAFWQSRLARNKRDHGPTMAERIETNRLAREAAELKAAATPCIDAAGHRYRVGALICSKCGINRVGGRGIGVRK